MARAHADGDTERLPARGGSGQGKHREARRLGRPVDADGQETRHRILQVARECFATYGYGGTTNRIIAEQTGYTSAAIYHHFGRKDDLMLAIYQATEREDYARMRVTIEGRHTLIEKVEAIFEVTQRILVEDRAKALFMLVVAREESRRLAELGEISVNRAYIDLFTEIVLEAVKLGEVEPANAQCVRGVLMVLTAGLVNLGTELSPAAQKAAAEGCKRLLAGELLRCPA